MDCAPDMTASDSTPNDGEPGKLWTPGESPQPAISRHCYAAIAFLPRLRARFGCGTRSPGKIRSSKARGSFANTSCMAGVGPAYSQHKHGLALRLRVVSNVNHEHPMNSPFPKYHLVEFTDAPPFIGIRL